MRRKKFSFSKILKLNPKIVNQDGQLFFSFSEKDRDFLGYPFKYKNSIRFLYWETPIMENKVNKWEIPIPVSKNAFFMILMMVDHYRILASHHFEDQNAKKSKVKS